LFWFWIFTYSIHSKSDRASFTAAASGEDVAWDAVWESLWAGE
jgi:hypothetical protein